MIYQNQVYRAKQLGIYHQIGKQTKPNARFETFKVRFSADWTDKECKLSIWYNDNLLGNISDDDGTNYTFLLPQLSEQHHWYPCATPYNKGAWVKIKYS